MAVGAKSTVPVSQESRSTDSAAGCLLRSIWLMVGNIALIFVAVFIVKQRQGLGLTWADGLYWGIAALPIAARYIDVRFFDGLTSEGEPATMRHWMRHSVLLLVAALALWCASHLVAHVLTK